MKIKAIKDYNPAIRDAVDHLLNFLIEKHEGVTAFHLEQLISSDNSHLFFALNDEDACMGMLTVGTYLAPTGKKAWIEDVVVDELYRGGGVGKSLVKFAVRFAAEQQADLLMLTSNPARVAANGLYKSMGFERKETNVYKMTF